MLLGIVAEQGNEDRDRSHLEIIHEIGTANGPVGAQSSGLKFVRRLQGRK